MWEDSNNARGGKWQYSEKRFQVANQKKLYKKLNSLSREKLPFKSAWTASGSTARSGSRFIKIIKIQIVLTSVSCSKLPAFYLTNEHLQMSK